MGTILKVNKQNHDLRKKEKSLIKQSTDMGRSNKQNKHCNNKTKVETFGGVIVYESRCDQNSQGFIQVMVHFSVTLRPQKP